MHSLSPASSAASVADMDSPNPFEVLSIKGEGPLDVDGR